MISAWKLFLFKITYAHSNVLLYFPTDYELIGGTEMDPEIKPKSGMHSSQIGGLQLVMASPRTRARGVRIGRKLPRTPAEYAELNRKTGAAEFPQSANRGMAPSRTKQLEPSRIQSNFGPPALDNTSEPPSTLPEASECHEGSSRYRSYIVLLSDGNEDDAKLHNVLPSKQSACHVTGSAGEKDTYETLNSKTMDHTQGSDTTGYEKLNKATMEPQSFSTDLGSVNSTMHLLAEGTSKGAGLRTRSDDKTTEHEKPNPKTIDSYQGSATTGYEKLNKATMEPQPCSAYLDDKSVAMHLDEGTSQNACVLTKSDDKTIGHGKPNPKTMDNFQGSITTDYEKLNKTTMEPRTWCVDFECILSLCLSTKEPRKVLALWLDLMKRWVIVQNWIQKKKWTSTSDFTQLVTRNLIRSRRGYKWLGRYKNNDMWTCKFGIMDRNFLLISFVYW